MPRLSGPTCTAGSVRAGGKASTARGAIAPVATPISGAVSPPSTALDLETGGGWFQCATAGRPRQKIPARRNPLPLASSRRHPASPRPFALSALASRNQLRSVWSSPPRVISRRLADQKAWRRHRRWRWLLRHGKPFNDRPSGGLEASRSSQREGAGEMKEAAVPFDSGRPRTLPQPAPGQSKILGMELAALPVAGHARNLQGTAGFGLVGQAAGDGERASRWASRFGNCWIGVTQKGRAAGLDERRRPRRLMPGLPEHRGLVDVGGPLTGGRCPSAKLAVAKASESGQLACEARRACAQDTMDNHLQPTPAMKGGCRAVAGRRC